MGGSRSDKTSNLLGRKELIKRWLRRKARVFLELLSDLLRDRQAHVCRWRACKSSEEERTSRRDQSLQRRRVGRVGWSLLRARLAHVSGIGRGEIRASCEDGSASPTAAASCRGEGKKNHIWFSFRSTQSVMFFFFFFYQGPPFHFILSSVLLSVNLALSAAPL